MNNKGTKGIDFQHLKVSQEERDKGKFIYPLTADFSIVELNQTEIQFHWNLIAKIYKDFVMCFLCFLTNLLAFFEEKLYKLVLLGVTLVILQTSSFSHEHLGLLFMLRIFRRLLNSKDKCLGRNCELISLCIQAITCSIPLVSMSFASFTKTYPEKKM
jgi:hypothetical protein